MKTVHVVPHTHWDREWYFTTQDSLVLMDQLFVEVIEELEKDENAKFCLDGQSSIIEEFLAIRPEYTQRLIDLVKSSRLSVGPWYTQTDCLYVDGESIIRNLSYGIYQSKMYGGAMEVAYLPDTFGFNAQMPTIIKNSGIKNMIFRRGADFDVNLKDSYFKWNGLGNKSVNTVHLLEGYGMAYGLNTSPEFREQRMFPYIKRVEDYTKSDNVVICAGGDQTNINKNMEKKLEEINQFTDDKYVQSTYEEFFDAAKDYFSAEYRGELREGRYDRVHRTIGGIRYDIKLNNFLVERKLLNRVEPLVAFAKIHDIEISTHLIYKAWKLLMEGQAHDGMGGCITDNVAKQVLDRFNIADEICDGVENLIKYKIAEQLDLQENEIIIFNTDIHNFKGNKFITCMSKSKMISFANNEFETISIKHFEGKKDLLIENPEGHIYVNEDEYYQLSGYLNCEIAPLSYKVFTFEKAEYEVEKVSTLNHIANDHFTISFENGDLELMNKKTNKIIKNFISFEDVGNDGDTYDFSPLREDNEIKFKCTKLNKVHSGALISTMELEASVMLPADLNSRINKQHLNEFKMDVKLEIDATNIIKVKCECDNNVYSHRLRMVVDSSINSDSHIASVPFGFLERKQANGEIKNWDGHNEAPIDIYPLDELCALTDDMNSMYIITKGLKEYQVIDSKFYITLLTTTSELGKPNLVFRPGRASGDTTKKGHVMIPTPLAEQMGVNSFELSIAISNETFSENNAVSLLNSSQDRNISYQRQTLNKFVNRLDNKIFKNLDVEIKEDKSISLMDINTDLMFSSLSPSLYDENYFLLRLKNMTKDTINIGNIGVDYLVTNSVEEVIENVSYVEAYDFITLKISYNDIKNFLCKR